MLTNKAILREATRRRIVAERAALRDQDRADGVHGHRPRRLEEAEALKRLGGVPSVFAFAEQYAEEVGQKYHRPAWADQAWGAE